MDVDGTILDTESITTIVLQKMLEKYKIQLTEDVRKKTIGYSTSDVYIMFTKIYDISVSYEEFLEDKEHFEKIYMKNIQLMPGALDLINWFYENEISIAAATNSKRHEIERKIVNHTELFKKFQHITTGDEVERLKPYPDIYLHSASKFIFLPEPTEILAIEDSRAGVEAACAAGMQVVWVSNQNIPKEEQRRATKFITSLHEFRPEEFYITPL
ncbi:hypothetical protein PGB90_001095 [Kerria lacca]